MNKSFKVKSNCVQGHAEEFGTSSTRFSPRRYSVGSLDSQLEYISSTHIHYNKIIRSYAEYFDDDYRVEIINNYMDNVLLMRDEWDIHLVCIRTFNENDNIFDPQFGLESVYSANFALDTLAKFAGVNVPDLVVREIEGVILLLTNLSQQTTLTGVLSAIGLHIRYYSQKSLTHTILDYVSELLNDFTTQSGDESMQPDWLSCLRDVRQNWQLCRHNRAFKQISKIIGIFVVLGLCKASDVEFSLGRFKVFEPNLFDKHANAWDLADAMFETVTFFAESMYLSFKTKSFKPLLINDHSALEMDEEFARIKAWWDLVKVGNLNRFSGMSDQEFERRLNTLTTNLKNLSLSLKGLDKKLVMDNFSKCLVMQNDFVTMKISSGVRHSPFAIELFGESSQGKTTLGDQLLDALLVSANLPTEKNYRAAYNAGDKYMSNWTSDKVVLLFDDCSNEKSNFVERPPTRAILDVCNNQMYYANKAELEAKGKCFVEPWIVVATTNKKDLDAGLYSNCPYSIQRRMLCYTVNVKPEFRKVVDGVNCGIDSTKVREFYTKDGVYTAPAFDDIWLVTIEEAVKPSSLHLVATYKPVTWRGKEMVNVPMSTVIQFSIEAFQDHRKNQEAILSGMVGRCDNLQRCSDTCVHIKGNCPIHNVLVNDDEIVVNDIDVVDRLMTYECTNPLCQRNHRTHEHVVECQKRYDSQFGFETVKSVRKLYSEATDKIFSFGDLERRIDSKASEILYLKGSSLLQQFAWVKCVPHVYIEHPYFREFCLWFYKDDLVEDFRKSVVSLWTMIFLLSLISLFIWWPLIIFVLFIGSSIQKRLYDYVEDQLFERLSTMNMQVHPIVRKYRDECAKYICGAFVGVASIYAIAKAYKAFKAHQPQGSLEPKTREEVEERDAETNVWTQVVKRPLPSNNISATVNADVLEKQIMKNLVYGSIYHDDKVAMLNALFLKSNVVVIPTHYFLYYGKSLNCTFRKAFPDKSGGKFACRIEYACSVNIPNTDISLCYCPNGGSFTNLIKHFPSQADYSTPFRLIYRKKDGETIHAKGYLDTEQCTTYMDFIGGVYKKLSINTFDGMCGAVCISDNIGSTICGIHVGGKANTPSGCCAIFTQSMINDAIDVLKTFEGVTLSGDGGNFRPEVLGVSMLTDDDVHVKSPLNYMPQDSQVEYFGSCIGRTIMKSDVKVTPISEAIMDVCGVPNQYCAPKMNPDWYAWQTCLANLANPALPYEYSLLKVAVEDYKSELIPIFKMDMWNDARPLTDHENLCGIPGKKFMDAIKLDTSIGYPLAGPKRKFVTELEPTEDKPNNRILDDEIIKEIQYCEDCYRRGERAYPIAKACKKDEILTKDKCRIFYGNALSLTWLIRKYYLPILRVLQMNPLVSECAVGINSHGPEWEEFHRHVTKFGMDRLFGGDYGKYDQKIPSQLILAALRIMIDFARECDYTDEDLKIMEAMTGDIVYAVIAFNGDLIGLTEGTHISGNSLTVVINGICGSLNLRCCYYKQHPPQDGVIRPFRKYVKAMTYGDDNIGSISPEEEKFTIKNISEFLGEYGQIYTMPDKESELLDYLPEDEFEFLKRKSVYHPELGVHIGALLEKSIFKSLHCFMRPKGSELTEEHACAINIDGALREWFNHGPEVYEMRRKQMKEVANKCNLSHLCFNLDKTYQNCVDEWIEKYGPR